MKKFNDFELSILHQLSNFQSQGVITIKNLLEKIYFNQQSGKAIILQLKENYALFFLSSSIFLNSSKQKQSILELTQLVRLLDFLKDNGIIAIFRKEHTIKSPIFLISDYFNEPIFEKDKIIVNTEGAYTDKPEVIKNKEGHIIYNGIQFNDSSAIIKNMLGSIVISDEINALIPKKKTKTKTFNYFNQIKKGKYILTVVALLFLLLQNFHLHQKQSKKNQKQLNKIHKQIQGYLNNSSVITLKSQKQHKLNYGIDISKWNGDILNNKLPDSLYFVICKATQGEKIIDNKFDYNWNKISKLQLKRGAYHFFVIDDNPEKQAIHYWNTVKNLNIDDFPPIVDIETASGYKVSHQKSTALEKKLFIFLNTIEKLSDRIPMIYSSHQFANKHLVNKKFAKYPLWIADYESKEKPLVPNVWKHKGWKIWQKSDYYDINSNKIDFDVLNY